jgi:hypothetical protein
VVAAYTLLGTPLSTPTPTLTLTWWSPTPSSVLDDGTTSPPLGPSVGSPSLLPAHLAGALRAYRDYFQLELFRAVGLAHSAALFASSEFAVSVLVLTATAGFGFIDDNRKVSCRARQPWPYYCA